jgi:3-dehydroquinate synthase
MLKNNVTLFYSINIGMIYTIEAENYRIELGSLQESSFEEFMNENYFNSRKIILVDENTNEHCLEYLLTSFSFLSNAEVIVLPEGEENKVMDICLQVWETWSEYGFDRKDVLINLGGGVITDMGGFIASLYKRGIDFVNIPTTLLSMVDASIGGKTGVDLGSYKNQIGVFSNPKAVYIDPGFTRSLPEGEVYNGFAEMLKHGLALNESHWNEMASMNQIEDELNEEHIYASLLLKNAVVLEDPFESDLRKKLNFGHTIGHALEGYFLEKDPISHGYAVALGILAESYISFKRNYITLSEFQKIEEVLTKHYYPLDLSKENVNEIYQLMLNDKKNFNGEIKCVLLVAIGQSVINKTIEVDEIISALEYLNRLYLEVEKD